MKIFWKTKLGGTNRQSKVHGVYIVVTPPEESDWLQIWPDLARYISFCGISWLSYEQYLNYKQKQAPKNVDCKRCRVTHHYLDELEAYNKKSKRGLTRKR